MHHNCHLTASESLPDWWSGGIMNTGLHTLKWAALGALVLSSGCNQYEMLRVAGYQQENYSNDVDILFVVDNSQSMAAESEELAVHFDTFIGYLTDPERGGAAYGGLTDATVNYIRQVSERGQYLDYQLAITTTDVEATFGDLYSLDPESRILANEGAQVGDKFRQNLLCTATCFKDFNMQSNPDHVCGDPIGDQITRQYLDCLCGEETWEDQCGSGSEEGLEAIFMAMCRAAENPPEACFSNTNQFTEAHVGSNAGLIRKDSTLFPIIVTDEGDNSRRIPTGEALPESYANLFKSFDTRMGFAVIGPQSDRCNNAAATRWGIERYQWFVDNTGGLYLDIAQETADEDCSVADFSENLEALGTLFNSLLDVFPLQSVPDVPTLKVFVENREVAPSMETLDEVSGSAQFGPGWRYLAAENGILFVGDAIPDYNADVRIFYRPLDGMPRELPYTR